jgi:hypothetical protein
MLERRLASAEQEAVPMVPRRIVITTTSIALLLTATVTPAAAAGPARTPPPVERVPGGERPLTPQELALSDRKVAAAEAYVASVRASGGGLSTLACVTPNGAPDVDTAGDPTTTSTCYVPSGFLPVQARNQLKSTYCGPAVGQVIANYAWAMKSNTNKYSQDTIATWMLTNQHGLTNAPELATGLQKATVSSPRFPADFAWGALDMRDRSGNGNIGDELQDYVRAAVSGWKMPLAIPVKPHDKNSDFNLSSWPNPVASPGHWITAYGWYSYWTGPTLPRIYYADSSKNYGGGTGTYWDRTSTIANLIAEHTKRIVW